ncbi:hypothetical protein KP509_35G017800 [Ceratopteris richardii]|nr:hypothetical protein KP509_35G017800 [Ceratopteris richardii]
MEHTIWQGDSAICERKGRQKFELYQTWMADLTTVQNNPCLIPDLPNDIAKLCLAKVPRLNLMKLRVVCTSWKHLIESREFYDLRYAVGYAEPWILVLAEKPSNSPFKAFCTQNNKWHELPAFPYSIQTSQWQGFSCVGIGCNLLLMGGMHFEALPQQGKVSGDVYIYNASTNKWSKGSSMNTPRSWFAATVIGNYVYVAGGQGKDRFLNSVEVYDLEHDSWSYVPSMILIRSSCRGLALKGRFWVIGGEIVRNQYGGKLMRGSAEVYDPETCSWTMIPEMWLDTEKVPGPTTVLCGKLVSIHRSKVMMYENDGNCWCHIGYLPDAGMQVNSYPRFGFAMQSIDDKLYIVGGVRASRQCQHCAQTLNTTEVCDLSFQGGILRICNWQSRASMDGCEGNVLASAIIRI